MTKAHTVLIVGCGNIGGAFDATRPADAPPLSHAGAFTRDLHFQLAACVDPDATRRHDFMARWGVPDGAASVAELEAAEGDFDVISLCSPTALHADHLRAALALRPRLIFCEKPLTPSVAQSEKLVAACRDAGVLLAVNHNRRWDRALQRLRDDLKSGRLGPLRSVVASYNKGVLNNGSHMVDLLHLLLGPLELQATGAAVHDFWPDDPSIPALLRTMDGVPVHLSTTHAGDYALFELTLNLADASLTMEDGGLAWRTRRRIASPHFASYQVLDAGERTPGEYMHTMRRAVDNLHAALLDEAPLASTGDTALQAQRLCELIRHAARATTPAPLPALHPFATTP